MLTVFVVSDATGETAERMVRSALVQFEDVSVTLIRRGLIRTPDQVRAVVQEAANEQSIVLHTLVSDELRRLMLDESRVHNVDALDMMGPVLDRLATHLQLTPQERPGLYRQLMEAKQRQVEAVDFAFRHDDGQNADNLPNADVVLVGISRSMKTPTMLYLAYRGWFAANVPIVLEVPPPPALLQVPSERVFCLKMSASRLQEWRRTRAREWNIPEDPYATIEQIHKELNHASRLCLEYGWRQIETTGKSVEEVSREIIALLSAEKAK